MFGYYDFCKFKITCLSDRRESKATPISVSTRMKCSFSLISTFPFLHRQYPLIQKRQLAATSVLTDGQNESDRRRQGDRTINGASEVTTPALGLRYKIRSRRVEATHAAEKAYGEHCCTCCAARRGGLCLCEG